MSKASIISLVNDLSLGLADPNLIDDYFYDIIHDLGDREVLLDATLTPVDPTSTTHPVYPIPETAVKLFGVFYGERYLARATLLEVEAFAGINWRDIRGEPFAFVVESENERYFRLFPNPQEPTDALVFPTGVPFGLDYPRNAMAVVASMIRDDIPEWLELPITMEIMGREFARESDHKDNEFAQICKAAAQLFFGMMGVAAAT
jgi:hypothetical protein